MGCVIAAGSASEASCNATCASAQSKCSFVFGGATFAMCSVCPNRWLNPETLTPEILPGAQPWWPPGFALPSCNSCDDIQDECMLGCRLFFNPGLNPQPTPGIPPPPTPMPPAPWPNPAPGFNFSSTLSDNMVLQQMPAAAAVFGNTGASADAAVRISVTVTPSSPSSKPYTVPASVAGGRWKALLSPTPSDGTTTYTVTATCSAGCPGSPASVSLHNVVFGDVWYCAGQR
jgi:hypothetical protein